MSPGSSSNRWSLWQPLVGSSPYLLVPGARAAHGTRHGPVLTIENHGSARGRYGTRRRFAASYSHHPTGKREPRCTYDTPDSAVAASKPPASGPGFRMTIFGT